MCVFPVLIWCLKVLIAVKIVDIKFTISSRKAQMINRTSLAVDIVPSSMLLVYLISLSESLLVSSSSLHKIVTSSVSQSTYDQSSTFFLFNLLQ